MIFNTIDLINALSGKNKAFIKRVSNHQEQRYGNVDVFSAIIYCKDDRYWHKGKWCCVTEVEMQFGENWIDFYINDRGEVIDTYGNGQGHKYHKSLESCAKELLSKYDFMGARKNHEQDLH